jgi:hypothetical protein
MDDLDSYEAARRGQVSAPIPVTPDTAESVQADKTLEDKVLAGGAVGPIDDDSDIPFAPVVI